MKVTRVSVLGGLAFGAVAIAALLLSESSSLALQRLRDTPVTMPVPVSAAPPASVVSARGRLEAIGGAIRIYGPADPVVVVSQLVVSPGEIVKEGQRIALLDHRPASEAELERATAAYDQARLRFKDAQTLFRAQVLARVALERRETELKIASAGLKAAQVAFDRSEVRSPFAARILEVHTGTGERVSTKGIVELARTHEMVAIAEVYESDIRRIRMGQSAIIESPALTAPLRGKVRRIGNKVGKADAIEDAPAARVDARVVEVEIDVDEDELAAHLSNLQVEIQIDLGSAS